MGNNADYCLKYESLKVALLRKKRDDDGGTILYAAFVDTVGHEVTSLNFPGNKEIDVAILPSIICAKCSQTKKDAIIVKPPQQTGNWGK